MGKRVNPQFITKWGGGFRDQILSRVPRIPGGIDSFVDPQECRLLPKDDAARSRAEFWVVHESCEVAESKYHGVSSGGGSPGLMMTACDFA